MSAINMRMHKWLDGVSEPWRLLLVLALFVVPLEALSYYASTWHWLIFPALIWVAVGLLSRIAYISSGKCGAGPL